MTGADGERLPADPRLTQSLVHRVATALRDVPTGTQPVVLCSDSKTRALMRQLTDPVLPTVPFLSVFEVPDGVRVIDLP